MAQPPDPPKVRTKIRKKWSGRADSNRRPLDPQSSALTRLRYAPDRPSHRFRPEGSRNVVVSVLIATQIVSHRTLARRPAAVHESQLVFGTCGMKSASVS